MWHSFTWVLSPAIKYSNIHPFSPGVKHAKEKKMDSGIFYSELFTGQKGVGQIKVRLLYGCARAPSRRKLQNTLKAQASLGKAYCL